jgi:two-component system LytT family response regulator
MKPWRVVIADDEPLARRGVRQLLALHKAFEVVCECRDGLEASKALAEGEIDLIFLDIAMPGLDGIAVARERTSDAGAIVVFLTAHSTRAVEAFEADAADYLVKPVTEARFARTIARVSERLQARRSGVPTPTLLAHTTRGTVILPASEVEWIEGANHYARVWHEGRGYLVREPLDALEERLAGAGFVRVHRGALVRRAAIIRLGRDAEGRPAVVLASRAVVPVARRRVAAVQRML